MNPAIGTGQAVPERTALGRALSLALVCEAIIVVGLAWWLGKGVTMAKPEEQAPVIITLSTPEAPPAPPEERKPLPPPPPQKTATARVKTAQRPETISPQPAPAVSQPADTPVADALMPMSTRPEAPASEPAPTPPTADEIAAFEGQVRAAVQAVLVYPPAARMMRREGQAKIAFDYLDGRVDAVHVAQTSGMTLLDAAAMVAVRSAAPPLAPPKFRHILLHLTVWVQFQLAAA